VCQISHEGNFYTKLIRLQRYEKISEKCKFFPKEFFKSGGIFWKTGFGGGLDGGRRGIFFYFFFGKGIADSLDAALSEL
jgi:hypothetical protein